MTWGDVNFWAQFEIKEGRSDREIIRGRSTALSLSLSLTSKETKKRITVD